MAIALLAIVYQIIVMTIFHGLAASLGVNQLDEKVSQSIQIHRMEM
jgi:hypothetical protein